MQLVIFTPQLLQLIKIVLPLYLVCLVLYIIFTRQPDYADGEFTPATIHFILDSAQRKAAIATFEIDSNIYSVNAYYPLRKFKENEQVTVIYDTADPHKAAVYAWWGYWLQWKELVASFIGIILLYYAAVSITQNPKE